MRAAALTLAFTLLLALGCGCTATRYEGIDLKAGGLAEVLDLARSARAGDKHAQLALGDRFVSGDGVPRDLRRARRLYTQAAQQSGGMLWIYSPPVKKGQSGRVIPVSRPLIAGLPEAKDRLDALENGMR